MILQLRQWNRVKDAITGDAEDKLIIEGYPTLQGDRHVLLAQSCVSARQERERKIAQHAAPEAPHEP